MRSGEGRGGRGRAVANDERSPCSSLWPGRPPGAEGPGGERVRAPGCLRRGPTYMTKRGGAPRWHHASPASSHATTPSQPSTTHQHTGTVVARSLGTPSAPGEGGRPRGRSSCLFKGGSVRRAARRGAGQGWRLDCRLPFRTSGSPLRPSGDACCPQGAWCSTTP